MVGLTLEAVGCRAPVGGRCLVLGVGGEQALAPLPIRRLVERFRPGSDELEVVAGQRVPRVPGVGVVGEQLQGEVAPTAAAAP